MQGSTFVVVILLTSVDLAYGQTVKPDRSYSEQISTLQDSLFKNYHASVRPVETGKEDRPIEIDMFLRITHLEEVNETQETLTCHATLFSSWMDFYMKWNRSEYPLLTRPILLNSPDRLWTPMMILVNQAEGGAKALKYTPKEIYVLPEGRVFMRTQLRLKITCDFDFSTFPYDTQSCPVVFRLPFYTAKEVNFRSSRSDMLLSWEPEEMSKGPERKNLKTLSAGWKILSITGEVQYLKRSQQELTVVETYPDPHELAYAWPFFVFKVGLKRFQSYAGILLIMPMIFTSLVTLISFFITSYSTVVLVVISNLVLQALYLLELLKITPISSGSLPGVVCYFGLNFCSTFITFLLVFAICTIEDWSTPSPNFSRLAESTVKKRNDLVKLILKRQKENAENDPNPPSLAKVQSDFAYLLRIATFIVMAILYFYGAITYLCP